MRFQRGGAPKGNHSVRSISIPSLTTALTALALLAPTAYADTAVVPSAFTNAEGNSSYLITPTFSVTYQQVYHNSLLTSLAPGTQITGMRFRADGGWHVLSSGSYNFATFDVRIGTSTHAPGSLSATVADNLGADTIQARSGSLFWAAGSFPSDTSPSSFGPLIDFTTPYTYNGGDLLLTVSHSAGGGDTLLWDAAQGGGGPGLSRAEYRQTSGVVSSPTTDTRTNAFGLIIQFETIVPASSAPEPGTVVLLTLGGILLPRALRRKR
jgi:hypothetical protein